MNLAKYLNKYRNYVSNMSFLFFQRFFVLGISFFIGAYVAKYLGPEKFGILSYSLSLCTLFSAIASLGLRKVIVREIVNQKYKEDEIISTGLILYLLGSLIFFLLIIGYLYIWENDAYTRWITLIISLSFILQNIQIFHCYFQAKVLSKYTVFFQVSSLVLVSILKIVFVKLKMPLYYFAVLYLVDVFISLAGISIIFLTKFKKKFKLKFNYDLAKYLLSSSWPYVFSGLMASIFTRIDQVMIRKLLTVKELGYYSVAVKLTEAWNFYPMIISSTFFPAIVAAKNDNIKKYHKFLTRFYGSAIWGAIIMVIVMYLLSEPLIKFLFGEEYYPSILVLKIYAISFIATTLGVASSQYLVSENLTKIDMARTMSGMVMNVLINILLIPRYGILGAAIATSISYLFAFCVTFAHRKVRAQIPLYIKAFFFNLK